MKTISALLAATMLVGCASPQKAEDVIRGGLVDGAIETAKAPLFKLTCPSTGCIIGSLEVGNPSGGAALAEVVRVVMTPQPSPSERIWLSIVDKGFGAIGIGLVSNGVKSVMGNMFASQTAISTGAFSALQGTAASGFTSNANIAGLIQAPAANITNSTTTTTNTATTTTLSGSGLIGNGSYTTTTNSQNPVTTTTSPRVCSTSATGVLTCQGG